MAKPDNKHQQHKPARLSQFDDNDSEDLDKEKADQSPADAAPEKAEKHEKEEKAEKPERLVKTLESDLVTINMFVDADPAPTVGHPAHGGFSFIEKGIMKLEARKSYVVPASVAAHLADKKMCSIAP